MTTPCDAVINSPKPPEHDPEPTWGGNVFNATTSSGVQGATVRLFKCNGTSVTEVDDVLTNSNGDYEFSGGGFVPEFYYYAKVDVSGPLAGMSPITSTPNPCVANGVGPNVSDVDFGFE